MKKIIKPGMIVTNEINFEKGQIWKVEEFREMLDSSIDKIEYKIQIGTVYKSGKVAFKNLTYNSGAKFSTTQTNRNMIFTLI